MSVHKLAKGLLCVFASAATAAHAQESSVDLASKLANPVAALISVPFQNNLDFGGGRDGALRYTLDVQPVVPFSINRNWNLISRTIIPLSYSERVFDDHRWGMGDTVQSFFLSPSQPSSGGVTWGIGPALLIPTGTDGYGQRQWGAGPTGVVLRQEGPWIYGALANHLWSLGGTPDRSDPLNATFLQPFVNYVFPTQTTVFLNTESTYDWSHRQWTVPVNLGVNQLVSIGSQKVQLGGGIRYEAEGPAGRPDWGLRFNLVFVFPR